MAAERHIHNYPPGLDDVAQRFDITVLELLEEIASGELLVVRPDDDPEETSESVLESLRQGLLDVKEGRTISASQLWDALQVPPQAEAMWL